MMGTSRSRRPLFMKTELAGENEDDMLPLDEQEQDELIEALRIQDESRNAFFILAFTLLSLFPTIFHIVRLYHGNFGFLDVLSISSLFMTTYTLRYIPLSTPRAEKEFLSPTQKFIPYLNPILVVVLTFKAFAVSHTRFDHDRDFWFLPLAVWLLVVLGRIIMASINVGELEKLRYKYKGA